MGDRVLHALSSGISMSIAVTSTTLAEHRQRSKAKSQSVANRKKSIDDDQPPAYDEGQRLEIEWALDEAGTKRKASDAESADSDTTLAEVNADQFLFSHQIQSNTQATYQRLPELVLVPQRRPKVRSRGFVRAYPPILNQYSGIDQQTFIDFIEDFDKSTKAAPIYNIINIACFGISFAGHIGMAVASAVQFANGFAKDIHTRYKSNKFLDEVNEKLFKPRGLYVLVMTYQPKRKNEPLLEMGAVDDVTKATVETIAAKEHPLKKNLMKLKSTAGKIKNEEALPPCATLVYPSLDRTLEGAEPQQIGSQLALSRTTMEEYLDRRAQVKCAADYKDSRLAQVLPAAEQQKQFANRFCDPDHPVNSGSIFGIVTGGNWDPIAAGRVRRAKAAAKKAGEPELTDEEMHNVYMGRGIRGRKGPHERKRFTVTDNVLQRDILYLCVVNLPTEEEMRQVQELMKS